MGASIIVRALSYLALLPMGPTTHSTPSNGNRDLGKNQNEKKHFLSEIADRLIE
jgi:hypothetical protein